MKRAQAFLYWSFLQEEGYNTSLTILIYNKGRECVLVDMKPWPPRFLRWVLAVWLWRVTLILHWRDRYWWPWWQAWRCWWAIGALVRRRGFKSQVLNKNQRRKEASSSIKEWTLWYLRAASLVEKKIGRRHNVNQSRVLVLSPMSHNSNSEPKLQISKVRNLSQ